MKVKRITYAQAVAEAIDEEMQRDKDVILLGEDVGILGGNFKTTVGLYEKYGEWRVKDTPISENSFTGLGLGIALTGLRPIIEIMFGDFLMLAMDQIANQVAKIRYMSGGQAKIPLTIRTTLGGGRSSAAQHSQSLQALVCHIPGLKVVMPSSASDAKGLLKTAIRDDNPVIFFEHKMEYNKTYEVPKGEYTIPFGKANILKEGKDITIVGTSNQALKVQEVAEELAKEGISVEVIDPSFYYLDGPFERLTTANIPLPFSPALEFPVIPNEKKIYQRVKKMLIG
jgi:pyruvate dehydrogenase E1 component beta subunit